MPNETLNRKIKAYYDGECPICSAIMNAVRRSDQYDAFDLRDMHKEKSLPFKKAAIEKEIHVIDQKGGIHKGAQAIFKITERYSHLRLATHIARLPPIKALAPPVYRLVAANRHFIVGPASRIFWLKNIIIAAFCSGLYLCAHLWAGPRSYPTAPIFGQMPALNDVLAHILYAAVWTRCNDPCFVETAKIHGDFSSNYWRFLRTRPNAVAAVGFPILFSADGAGAVFLAQ